MGGGRRQRRDPRHAGRARPGRRLILDPGVLALGAAGAAWGLAADRLAVRWPAHEGGMIRGIDWRTAVIPAFGFAVGWALPLRWGEARDVMVVAAYLAVLVLLLATDLDQRILPDALTLPLIPAALLLLVAGWDPLLAGREFGLVSGLAAGVAFPALLLAGSLAFRGGLGMGDVKLLVGVGLFSGISALLRGFIVSSLVFGLVLLVLIFLRRVSLRSYVPFGPVIIIAAAIAALLP